MGSERVSVESGDNPGDVLSGVRLTADGLEFGSAAIFQLFENIPVAISVTAGPLHRFVYANALYWNALVPDHAEIRGQNLRNIFGEGLPDRTYAVRDRVLAERRALRMLEEPIPPRSEHPSMFWDVTFFPLIDDAGVAAGILTFGVDVTARVLARIEAEQRAETERRRAEEESFDRARLELAVEATSLGIWEWNVETGETIWSDTQKAIWGLPGEQQVSYDTWRDSLHPDDREAVLDRLSRTLDPQSGGEQRLEHRIVRPSGAVRWISSRGRMVYDAVGKPLLLIGTALDITRQKKDEEDLTRALESKEILLREVNHRVKNSLQIVSSMLSLQALRLEDPALRDAIHEAQLRVQTVAAVHDRLYRSEDLERVELDQFLDTLCRELERTIADPDAIRIEVTTEPVVVNNDRAVPIALILNELLTNAIKYAYPGDRTGAIRVSLRRGDEAGRAVLTVADGGVGLPQAFGEKRGSSLGFRIIEGLSRQMDAEIAIVDRRPGTAVSVTFDVSSS